MESTSRDPVLVRSALPSDCEAILDVVQSWWGRPIESDMFSKFFLNHFSETCLIAERNGRFVGFLIGFLSQTLADEAYIRFVVVHPQDRGAGIGRALYEEFFRVAQKHQRRIIRSVTSPSNLNSVAFHQLLGFTIEPQEHQINNLPVQKNYHGREDTDRVLFVKICN
jgi:ribosomal protein S18 acetylase RimI-like enzyme